MSEEQGVYDGCNVVFPKPAEEPYPPQTGDLLGAYLARVSRRVRDIEHTLARFLTAVENANSYQEDYGTRIVALEDKFDEMENTLNDLCGQMNEYDIKHSKLRKRIKALERLEAKQAEAPAVTTPDEKPSEFMAGFDGKAIRESMNVPPVCATCGHAESAHIYDIDSGAWCRGGTLGKPCLCREYKPVA